MYLRARIVETIPVKNTKITIMSVRSNKLVPTVALLWPMRFMPATTVRGEPFPMVTIEYAPSG